MPYIVFFQTQKVRKKVVYMKKEIVFIDEETLTYEEMEAMLDEQAEE